jgi:hypothetical protein
MAETAQFRILNHLISIALLVYASFAALLQVLPAAIHEYFKMVRPITISNNSFLAVLWPTATDWAYAFSSKRHECLIVRML